MRSLFNKYCVKHKKGFTLFEILTVLIVLIVVISVAAPVYNKAVKRGRVSDGLKVLKMLENAQEKYFIRHGHYAARLTDLNVPIKELRGQDPGSPFTDIITTHFTYNKIPLQHCIYATPNKAKQNYTLVKNYKTKAKVHCLGDGCDAISGFVKKADEVSALCPAAPEGCTLTEEDCRKHKNSYLDPVKCECVSQPVTPPAPSGSDCSKEGSVRFINSGERCSGNRDSTSPGTPSVYVPCGIRFDEQTCQNGYWVNTGNYDCRQKTCGEGSGQVLNLETCECDTYKNCDPMTKPSCSHGITVCDPCPESPSIPNIVQQALMGTGGGNEKGEQPSDPSLSTECFHCGYKNSATTATCNHATGRWYCAGDENVECTQINGNIPLYNGSCDGNGTAGNACGGYKLTNVRCWQEITGSIPELVPQYSGSCSLKKGNECFSGQTRQCTMPDGKPGIQKCNGCKWTECKHNYCAPEPDLTPVACSNLCLTRQPIYTCSYQEYGAQGAGYYWQQNGWTECQLGAGNNCSTEGQSFGGGVYCMNCKKSRCPSQGAVVYNRKLKKCYKEITHDNSWYFFTYSGPAPANSNSMQNANYFKYCGNNEPYLVNCQMKCLDSENLTPYDGSFCEESGSILPGQKALQGTFRLGAHYCNGRLIWNLVKDNSAVVECQVVNPVPVN